MVPVAMRISQTNARLRLQTIDARVDGRDFSDALNDIDLRIADLHGENAPAELIERGDPQNRTDAPHFVA